MVRVLVYLLVIAAFAAGAVWLADRPGEVSILWQGYRIETSVAIAAIGVVVLAFLALVAWAIMRFVFGLPSAFGFASRARRRARGFEAISRPCRSGWRARSSRTTLSRLPSSGRNCPSRRGAAAKPSARH